MQQFSLKTSMLEKASRIVPLITLFLVPIFFLPITSEFFSLNKITLITLATLLLLISWGLKTITGEKLEIVKSPIDRSLLALSVVIVVSTMFSVNKTDSLFGSQGRWLGLVSFLTMVGYFYLTTPTFKEKGAIKMSLYILLVASTISSIASILSYYKIFIGSQTFLRIQNFSLTGSIKDAVLMASISVIVSLMLSIYEDFMPTKIVLSVLLTINFFFIAITRTPLGWVLMIMGIALIVIFIGKETLKRRKTDLMVPIILVLLPILALTLIPSTRSILIDNNYVGELTLPAKESWAIATSTIRDYPTLATGPATFHLNFSRFRPLSMNNTILWNNRFDKPYNELFNIISTIGIVGTLFALIWAGRLVIFAFSSKKIEGEEELSRISGVMLLLILVSFLVHHATILNIFLLFYSISILTGVHVLTGSDSKIKPVSIEITSLSSISQDDQAVITGQYTKYILSIPAFILAGYLGYSNFRSYAAEYYMRRSLNAITRGDITRAYDDQNTALKYNSKRDSYYDSLAKVNMTLATALAANSSDQLTDADKQNIQILITQSLRNSKIATEDMSPLNVANWETRAQLYRNLVNVAQNAYDWSINAYNTAIQLDPTNPRLRLDLGGVYFAKGEYLAAANLFRQAITLKQDYANARYNFALALIQLNEFDQAKRELDITKLLVPQGSEDEKMVDREISALISRAQQTTGTETDKPTVEELTGVEGTTQEPLERKGEQEDQDLGPEVLPQQRVDERPRPNVQPEVIPEEVKETEPQE